MKKIIFLLFLITAAVTTSYSQQTVQGRTVEATHHLYFPLDTLNAPLRIGEIRRRIQDGSLWKCTTLVTSSSRWEKLLGASDVSNVLNADTTGGVEIGYTDGNNFRLRKIYGSGVSSTAKGIEILSGVGGGDFSSNTATSVDNEIVLFSGTGGKTGKRSTGSGRPLLTSGVLSLSNINLASEVTGTLPVGNGGTGATSYTSGSIPYSNGTILTQNNSNLFWDNTNVRLGIGTNTPERGLTSVVNDAVVNNVSYPLRLRHNSSGTVVAGFGTGYEVELQNGSGINRLVAGENYTLSDVTNTSEDLETEWYSMTNGALTRKYSVNADGTIRFDNGSLYSRTGTFVFGINNSNTNRMSFTTANLYGTTDFFMQLFPGGSGYAIVESAQGEGLALSAFGGSSRVTISPNRTEAVRVIATGQMGVGVTSPTAFIHLKAGTATANTAPLKFNSGTNLSTPENGAVEYDGTNYFATAGGVRYTLAKTLTNTATLDFGSTNAGENSDLTITVTGAADGDVVSIGVPNGSISAASFFTAWVSATNTVTVRFVNNSGSPIDPASGTFRATIVKY